jgi:hypothetical protein
MNGLQTIQPAQSVNLCLFPVAKWVQWYHQPESVACVLALPFTSLFYMLQEVQVHQNLAWKGLVFAISFSQGIWRKQQQ